MNFQSWKIELIFYLLRMKVMSMKIQKLLLTIGSLCYYRMLGLQAEHTDPDMLLHHLLYYASKNEEYVLFSCVSTQDIIDQGHYVFFRSLESKELAWSYYCSCYPIMMD